MTEEEVVSVLKEIKQTTLELQRHGSRGGFLDTAARLIVQARARAAVLLELRDGQARYLYKLQTRVAELEEKIKTQ